MNVVQTYTLFIQYLSVRLSTFPETESENDLKSYYDFLQSDLPS
jgi:hypothetical protein